MYIDLKRANDLLKEKVASMEQALRSKNKELLIKESEITAMKAKLFNEEKLTKEKNVTCRIFDVRLLHGSYHRPTAPSCICTWKTVAAQICVKT